MELWVELMWELDLVKALEYYCAAQNLKNLTNCTFNLTEEQIEEFRGNVFDCVGLYCLISRPLNTFSIQKDCKQYGM